MSKRIIAIALEVLFISIAVSIAIAIGADRWWQYAVAILLGKFALGLISLTVLHLLKEETGLS